MNTTIVQTASITFSFDLIARRRVATFCGPITDRELLDAYTALLADPGYDSSLDDFIDLCGVTHMGVSSAGLHRLITMYDARDSPGHPTRTAILAPTDVLYGVSRMFQTMRGEDHPDVLEVFRTLDGAMDWLVRGPRPDTHGAV